MTNPNLVYDAVIGAYIREISPRPRAGRGGYGPIACTGTRDRSVTTRNEGVTDRSLSDPGAIGLLAPRQGGVPSRRRRGQAGGRAPVAAGAGV
jgi:hypothetical protein